MCTLIFITTIQAFALEWDGSSSGGGGGGTAAGPNGYAIRTTGDNCLGYRFSVVDKSGNNNHATHNQFIIATIRARFRNLFNNHKLSRQKKSVLCMRVHFCCFIQINSSHFNH